MGVLIAQMNLIVKHVTTHSLKMIKFIIFGIKKLYIYMKPNYICIGVQKGGTNSLIRYLNYHPEIYMVENEKHLFICKISCFRCDLAI